MKTYSVFVENQYKQIYEAAILLLESKCLCCLCDAKEIKELEQILLIVEERLKKMEKGVDAKSRLD